jgi:hypothetical protein
MPRKWCLLLVAIAGCGGGQYGYARTYQAQGDEGSYLSREVELSYEEVRRFPDRHQEELIGWFGIVRDVEDLDRQTGEARLVLDLRPHQERHLCSDETSGSCRVTVSNRTIGPFVATVRLRAEDLAEGPARLNRGSLVKIYGHVTESGTEESGPIIRTEYYRHWPHGQYVTTADAGRMRQ